MYAGDWKASGACSNVESRRPCSKIRVFLALASGALDIYTLSMVAVGYNDRVDTIETQIKRNNL